jgi:trimethylguanosine synthase
MDREGFFSVTPEALAVTMAEQACIACPPERRAKGLTVLDCFCGAGGNAVAFGLRPDVSEVIAVDLSHVRLECLRRNAQIYGVPSSKLTLILGDFYDVAARLTAQQRRVDVVLFAPPWGGLGYNRTQFDIDTGVPIGGLKALKAAWGISRRVLAVYPRDTAWNQIHRAERFLGLASSLADGAEDPHADRKAPLNPACVQSALLKVNNRPTMRQVLFDGEVDD